MSPTEQIEPSGPVLYASRYAQHKFVLEGARPVRDAFGNATGVLNQGKEIQFTNHLFKTTDPEEIAFMDRQIGPEIMRVESEAEVEPVRAQVAIAGTGSTATVVDRTGQPVRCDCHGRMFKNQQALTMHLFQAAKKAATEAMAG